MADRKLTPHDGREVLRTTVAITRAGDGLSEALKVDPTELHHGQRVFIVLEGVVGPIRYVPIIEKGTDTGLLERQHTVVSEVVTLVDGELVGEALTKQRQRIQEAKDAEAQQMTMLGADGKMKDDAVEAHNRGEHTKLVKGCPECDAEAAAVKSERAAKKAAGTTKRGGRRRADG